MTGGDRPHLDVEATLSQLWEMTQRLEARPTEDSGFDREKVDAYEERITRAQKWGGWVWGLVTIAVAIFTGGMGYAVFMGANATDAEVEKAVHDEITLHNGGTHPATIDPETHAPVGDHPDIRGDISGVQTTVDELKTQNDRMELTQRKQDKRGEYQFEFSRWQAEVTEAERKRKPRPKKPDRLRQLESDLMLGKYD